MQPAINRSPTCVNPIFRPVRRHKPKEATKKHKGGGGWSIGPLSSTFDTIYLIGLIFGNFYEFSLYFQLIDTE